MERLVAGLEAARGTRSRKQKVAHLAEAFARIAREEGPGSPALLVAARLTDGQTLAATDPRPLGVGYALVGEALAASLGTSAGALWSQARGLGDLGEAAERAVPVERPGLPLAEVAALLERLAATSERDEKLRALTAALSRARPLEAKYLVKALLGELRIGVQRGTLEEALAAAFGQDLTALRKAAAVVADAGDLASLAARGALAEARFTPGAPLAFMLASPTEAVKTEVEPAATVAEDKLDGIRCQVQAHQGQVWLFGRGQGQVTKAFPELQALFTAEPGPLALDGEVIALGEGQRARPFHVLQARLGRVDPDEALRASVPVALVLYDVMVDGEVLLEAPWKERRARLERLAQRVATARCWANPVHALDAAAPLAPQLEALFAEARGRGNEGLVLKRVDAPYEPGRRGSAWRKVKKALATLDVVVTRAEWGHGKRAGVMSDYTFAVWNGERLEEIGKAYTGLTDREIAQLTERFQALTVEVKRGQHFVRPEVVLEVAFDGLQRSQRHQSGLSMRFPRIHRIRDDKTAAQADTLAAAEALFQAQVDSGHREEPDEG
ncbi:MAG: hypothetical protein K1X89_18365 [Myxococcaceae bacterium]|nr:hypothetical protein [Myxococcaceae bacterium]